MAGAPVKCAHFTGAPGFPDPGSPRISSRRVAGGDRLRAGWLNEFWEGCRESRRCSRDTYPDSYITKYTSIRRVNPNVYSIESRLIMRVRYDSHIRSWWVPAGGQDSSARAPCPQTRSLVVLSCERTQAPCPVCGPASRVSCMRTQPLSPPPPGPVSVGLGWVGSA